MTKMTPETALAQLDGTPDEILSEAIRQGLVAERIPANWMPFWRDVQEANGTVGDLADTLDRLRRDG